MRDNQIIRPRVLIVDDEPAIREVVRALVERLECGVEEAQDGASALTHVRADAPVDLVILDLVLPGMSGQQVFWEIRKTGCVPVLFHSGYRGSETLVAELAEPATGFLQKPWSLVDLRQAIRALLLVPDST